ncbi:MAG: hypothetical protein A2017_09005 [Lentisphaerae bacterium GWF2_44_16]|nr:MAG: hypothetical protein A2017_09005 [Lentisphaerae bacterium GWF2_44_16]
MKNICNKFTLVELLIVISIIAILASMLLPALRSVREKANEINCKNNFRQIGTSAHLYASDYDAFLPPSSNDEFGSNVYWFPALYDRGYLTNKKLVLCVSNPKGVKDWFAGAGYPRINTNYGNNIMITSNASSHYQWYKLGSLSYESKVPMVFEAYQYPYFDCWISESNYAWPHKNRMNVLFLDNHVDDTAMFLGGNLPNNWKWNYKY